MGRRPDYRAPGGAWSPHAIPGLVLYLDARAGLTRTSDEVPKVAAWSDLSGRGHHATQSTSDRRPTYTESNADFNGWPTVDFDAVETQYLVIPAHADLAGRDGYTVYLVGEWGVGSPRVFGDIRHFMTGEGGAYWRAYDGVSGYYAAKGGTSPPDTARVLFRDGELRCRSDGIEATDTSLSGVYAQASDVGVGAMPNGNLPTTGKLAGIVRWNRWLAAPERAAIEAWIEDTWGVAL